VTDPAVLQTFTRVLAFLAAEIRQLQHSIAQLIAADPLWQPLDRAFRSIKGVADRTVACLMAELPEIGTLSNKAISKLVGLAPLADDSGKRHGHRSIRGGRTPVRHLLFVIATVVRRCQPDFAAFSQRLAARGKPKKVILVALAHKLLIRLNAKARDARRQFSPPIPSAAFTTTFRLTNQTVAIVEEIDDSLPTLDGRAGLQARVPAFLLNVVIRRRTSESA
jgi:transposase